MKDQIPNIVQDPVIRVEHQASHQADDSKGGGHRDDKSDPADFLKQLVPLFVQEQCDHQTQNQFTRETDNQEKEGPTQRCSKRVILKNRDVISEPGERGIVDWPDPEKVPMPVDFGEKKLVKRNPNGKQ